MPRRSAAQRQPEPETINPLPEVLIPPDKADPKQQEAYWIQLVQNPEELKQAFETTDFWTMLAQFPDSLWGSHLSIYLYRLESDGISVRNAEGQGKYIKPVIRQCIDQDWVANRHGGGKYQAWLKWDNKETIRKQTFEIDGPPKIQPGQTVEVEGKPIPLPGTAQQILQPTEPARTDIATVIEASASANKQNMEILAEGSKAAIALVAEQAKAAAKPDASSGLLEKLLSAVLERALTPTPVPDPIETLVKAKELFAPAAAASQPEPEDPPLEKAMDLVERITGKNFSDLTRGRNPAPQAESYGWVTPVAQAAQQFIAQLPQIMAEARLAREREFERQVWLRNSRPGEAPPAHLLVSGQTTAATPRNSSPQNAVQVAEAAPVAPNPAEVVPKIVAHICQWFDKKHADGYICAAQIDGLYGEQIEALGLEALLTNPEQMQQMITGHPDLAARSTHARWAEFAQGFMDYMLDRWGVPEGEAGEEEDDETQPDQTVPKGTKSTKSVPITPVSADKQPIGA